MKISEAFNPWNPAHLRAYKQYETTGTWPDDVLPSNIEYNPGWQFQLMDKIVQQWLDYMGILE